MSCSDMRHWTVQISYEAILWLREKLEIYQLFFFSFFAYQTSINLTELWTEVTNSNSRPLHVMQAAFYRHLNYPGTSVEFFIQSHH